MQKIIFSFFLIFLSINALALEWTYSIPTNETFDQKNQIEFEIATNQSFDSRSLIDQGFSTSKNLKGELQPGLYYLRYRKSQSTGQAWTNPVELLVASDTITTLLEPKNGAAIESPTSKSDVFFRWVKIAGATYQLELNSPANTKPVIITTQNPFITAKLSYGKWKAKVHVIFGTKRLTVSQAQDIELKPNTNVGVEFLNPSNDDVLGANKRQIFKIARSYEAIKSTLKISKLHSAGSDLTLESSLNPKSTELTISPLDVGTYQVSIEDKLNSDNVVESNIRIFVEEDPLELESRGTKTDAELLLGAQFGTISQRNHHTNDQTLYSDSDILGPTIGFSLKNKLYDPYNLQLSGELVSVAYEANRNSTAYSERKTHQRYALDLLYNSKFSKKPNALLLRSGLFWKNYHQVSSEVQSSGYLDQSIARLIGLSLGIDFEWRSFSTKWSMDSYIKIFSPILSFSDLVSSGSPSPAPSYEAGISLQNKISDYVHFNLTPTLKSERWIIKKNAESRTSSIQISHGLGINLGLTLEI